MFNKSIFLEDRVQVLRDGYIDLKRKRVKHKVSTSFSMVYDNQLPFWISLGSLEIKVMIYLMSINSPTDKDNCILLTIHQKKFLAKLAGVQVSSIEAAITKLLRKDGIRRVGRAMYELNPSIVTRNISQKDRLTRIRLREEAKLRESSMKKYKLSPIKTNDNK